MKALKTSKETDSGIWFRVPIALVEGRQLC
jgi:hypothetical protein